MQPPDERSADVHELVVYGASDCCLCDEAMAILREMAPALGIRLRYVTIDGDADLEDAYRQQIPVGFLDGRKIFKFRIDPVRLRRAVARACDRRLWTLRKK